MTTTQNTWTAIHTVNEQTKHYDCGNGDDGFYYAAFAAANYVVRLSRKDFEWQKKYDTWTTKMDIYCDGELITEFYEDSDGEHDTRTWLGNPLATSFRLSMLDYCESWHRCFEAGVRNLAFVSMEEMIGIRESGGCFYNASIYDDGLIAEYAWLAKDTFYEVQTITRQKTELLIQTFFSDAAERLIAESATKTLLIDETNFEEFANVQ